MATRVVFVGVGQLSYEKCKLPEIEKGQILAKILLATICGSDIHTLSGKRKEVTPSVLGHEAVAMVLENRSHQADVIPGDRITFSITDSCGHCDACRRLLPQKCHTVSKYGHTALDYGSGFSGCYASHIVLTAGTTVYKIPDHVTNKMAAPINCALATIMNCMTYVPSHKPIRTAVVQGAGMLGMYACAVLARKGAQRVYCSDINRQRLEMTSKFGAIPVYSGLQREADDNTIEANSVDLVIEVCGVRDVVKEAMRYLRVGGIYILVGMVHPDSDITLNAETVIRKCLTIVGVHNYSPSDLFDAVNFLGETAHVYPYEDLVGNIFNLQDTAGAFKVAASQTAHRVAVCPD